MFAIIPVLVYEQKMRLKIERQYLRDTSDPVNMPDDRQVYYFVNTFLLVLIFFVHNSLDFVTCSDFQFI